jgi:hypothetical protein
VFAVSFWGCIALTVLTTIDHRTCSIEEQLLSRNVERIRGGLVVKALKWLHHSTLGSKVVKKKKKNLLLAATLSATLWHFYNAV